MTLQRAASSVLVLLLLASSGPSCLDAAEYFYGYDLVDTRLVIYDEDMGVHPNQSVLNDPNNPFLYGAPGLEMRFRLLGYANSSAAFYAWATILAHQPTGENQYYTALLAQRIYINNDLSPAERPFVREIALNGFQAVLDEFPASVSYDPSGVFPFRLAPLAYNGILELGGLPPTGWEVVDGVVLAAPNDAQNAPDPVEEDE